jgi:hypothetical protein
MIIALIVVFIAGFIAGGISCVAFATYLEERGLVEAAPAVSEPILKTSTFKPDILYYND